MELTPNLLPLRSLVRQGRPPEKIKMELCQQGQAGLVVMELKLRALLGKLPLVGLRTKLGQESQAVEPNRLVQQEKPPLKIKMELPQQGQAGLVVMELGLYALLGKLLLEGLRKKLGQARRALEQNRLVRQERPPKEIKMELRHQGQAGLVVMELELHGLRGKLHLEGLRRQLDQALPVEGPLHQGSQKGHQGDLKKQIDLGQALPVVGHSHQGSQKGHQRDLKRQIDLGQTPPAKGPSHQGSQRGHQRDLKRQIDLGQALPVEGQELRKRFQRHHILEAVKAPEKHHLKEAQVQAHQFKVIFHSFLSLLR